MANSVDDARDRLGIEQVDGKALLDVLPELSNDLGHRRVRRLAFELGLGDVVVVDPRHGDGEDVVGDAECTGDDTGP